MDDRQLIKMSKYLSKHLRHQPQRLGLSLDPAGGWVSVADLLRACQRVNFKMTREDLDEVVSKNNKQRFSFDDSGERIRANQGHSVDVDLDLPKMTPPDRLYHGTGAKSALLIEAHGLDKMSRHHVHLSVDKQTARIVGKRHGKPVVFEVDSETMHEEGIDFYLSENGVWLVEKVPPSFLSRITD